MKRLNILICIVFCLLIEVTKAQFTTLLDFNNTNGQNPYGSLTAFGKGLYGLANTGGANNLGCIFYLDTNGKGYRDLYDFNGTKGKYPYGSLVLSGGVFYGMTADGGAHDSGCIFTVDTNGKGLRDLFDFNGKNGANPTGSLMLSGNKLYGMTDSGGANYTGCIFYIDTNGSGYKDLFDFKDSNSRNPGGSLILSGSKLYGMTSGGEGVMGFGNIFSIDTNGNGYKDLYDFNVTDSLSGQNPYGSLILSGKTLFGMTTWGGTLGDGVIFSIDTNGNGYRDLYNISLGPIIAYGIYPYTSLLLSGSVFYGVLTYGGPNGDGDGNIFAIDTTGKGYKDLYDFNSNNGLWPEGSLIVSGNEFYGMTNSGGANNDGIVFKFKDTSNVNSINELGLNHIVVKIFPNPSNGLFTIQSNTVFVNSKAEIYNMLGEIICTPKLNPTTTKIDLGNNVSGIYLYRIINEAGGLISTGRMIIQK